MDIKINTNKPTTYTAPKIQKTKETTTETQMPAKLDVWEKQPEWKISEMKSSCMTGEELQAFRKKAQEVSTGELKINWSYTVDPKGEIYNSTYIDNLLGSYQTMEQTIKAYYANDHQENLTFANPYKHIMDKYRDTSSRYFLWDMSPDEREMAFRQQTDLLRGTNVALNDPYALASLGGQKYISGVEERAKKAAQAAINELIAAYKQEHGIS